MLCLPLGNLRRESDNESKSILPIPDLGFYGQSTPIHIRVLQRQPGQSLNQASVKVRPIERVKKDLGRIPKLAPKITVAGVAKRTEIRR